MKKIGLIINPVAGMGGSVGLKGSDGKEILKKAVKLGAEPKSGQRTKKALKQLAPLKDKFKLITYPGEMGEEAAAACDFKPEVIGSIEQGNTKAEDTYNAALDLKSKGAELILFAGGDGTARDIYDAIGTSTAALGIPAGVKIHSAVYGQTPKRAGKLVKLFIQDKVIEFKEVEVMDIDEAAFREGKVAAKLYGYLKVPFEKEFIQSRKAGSVEGEEASLAGMVSYIVNNMEEDCIYVIGPGTTTRRIMDRLGLKNTLLGVDLIRNKKVIGRDLSAAELLNLIKGKKTKLIITIIGGQGHIFGRGNQQLSPEVIKEIGRDNIIVVASRNKLNTIFGSPLLIDTGDEKTNKMLEGYYRVVVGYQDTIIHKASS